MVGVIFVFKIKYVISFVTFWSIGNKTVMNLVINNFECCHLEKAWTDADDDHDYDDNEDACDEDDELAMNNLKDGNLDKNLETVQCKMVDNLGTESNLSPLNCLNLKACSVIWHCYPVTIKTV